MRYTLIFSWIPLLNLNRQLNKYNDVERVAHAKKRALKYPLQVLRSVRRERERERKKNKSTH